MSAGASGLCGEDDRSTLVCDDPAWCTPTEVLVGGTVPLDRRAMHGALTTTLPLGIDLVGVVDGAECVRSEDVLCSPPKTLLLTFRSITPSPAVIWNASSVLGSIDQGHGALLRGVFQFATTRAATTL